MMQLSHMHPQLYTEFLKGNFIVQKSDWKFSLIGKDQSHEHSNKNLQAYGGAVGLYDNPEALKLFMLAVRDCTRCINEFEAVLDTTSNTAHQEETIVLQAMFWTNVLVFAEVAE